MTMLIAGVLAWSLVHLFPAILPRPRKALIAKLGNNGYRGIYSLLILASLVLIVFGWKAAVPGTVYAPPLSGGPITSLLVLAGLVLFFSSRFASNIKRFLRHPQMTGTILWGVAHLLANGDSRSIVLFGGLTIWAVLEIVMINRRDGAWQKPAPTSLRNDIAPLAIGVVAFGVIAWFHLRLFGVPPFPT